MGIWDITLMNIRFASIDEHPDLTVAISMNITISIQF